MERARVFLLLLAGFVSFPALSAERIFVPQPGPGQSIRYENGVAMLYAETSRASALISFQPLSKKAGYVWVGVRNSGDTPFNISEQSISASANGIPLKVQTYADRVAAQRRSERWQSIGAGLAAGANGAAAANAGYSNQRGTYSGNSTATAYGSGGYAHVTGTASGTYSSTTYNAGAAAAAQQQAAQRNQAMFAEVRENSAAAKGLLESRALKAQTVDPGAIVTGDVEIQLPKRGKGTTLTAVVTIEGESIVVEFVETP